ncbi:ATPase subunit of ABC transporter with duplicated ATPase domains [Hydrogenispora ethanolica]|uniref:ATPase subunit of ABC transporter with duplicated ATPase domains n=1 Tax=Hydrogenispora ethanolica TaxID=1082276 RepID=A0A4R1QUS5_HYDET|nr:ABC-F family ATP-binding cassette domain-containing protein [Hydrogenispora ethanolica]TCL57729.1 ATPase subunit of ABC transporter with duplicated ATPase domains [Hydrogenispora ethanolica]
MSLLILENLMKEFDGRTLFDGVNLRVQRGERVALVGPNGSGKSTILKIVMGLEEADRGRVIVARNTKVGYISQSLSELADNNIMSETAKVFAHAFDLERRLRAVEAAMAEPAIADRPEALEELCQVYGRLTDEYEKLDGYQLEAKVKSTLLGLGLRREALTQSIATLSGGEKMRVALARTLLLAPELLILDEPTNHLDLVGMEWLEKFLRRFAGGVLLVSHDRYFLDQVATRVAELAAEGISCKSGNYSTFCAQKERRRDYLAAERKRIQREIRLNNELVSKLKGMRRIGAAASRAKAGERLREELNTRIREAVATEHLVQTAALNLPLSQAKHISAEIAKAENLTKKYGEVVIFDAARFLIRGGELIGLIGPNGSGKTTLLNILLGKERQFEGVARLGPWVRYGYLGQEIRFASADHTVLEELLATGAELGKELKEREARDYLSKFQFYGADVQKQLQVLSGGEQVRLALACICLREPHCLILDEPTNHLDMPAREALETALAGFKGTVIAVSHDRYFLNRCVNRILAIESGKITSYEGNYEDYRRLSGKSAEADSGQPQQRAAGTAKAKPGRTAGHSGGGPGQGDERAAIETRIEVIEKRLKELEATFDRDTPYHAYQEYQSLMAEVDALYAEWHRLTE